MKIRILILLCSLLLLAGCDKDRAAQQYAEKLAEVLKSYQEQVGQKINAETEANNALAAVYAHARTEDLWESLWLERRERAKRIINDLAKPGAQSITTFNIQALLRDYAYHDFERTKELLGEEASAQKRFLTGLAELEFEQKKIEALIEELSDLAKPKGRLQQMGDFAKFANAVDSQLHKLFCNDLTKQIEELKKQPQTDEIKNLVAKLEQRKKGKKCA